MTDSLAALTLEIVRHVQMPAGAAAEPSRWMVVPRVGSDGSAPAMAAWLAAAPKPLVVAPLVAPGEIAVWSLSSLDADARAGVEEACRNQAAYLGAKLETLGAADEEEIALETAAGRVALPVARFREWAASFVVTSCGITVRRDGERASLRIAVLRGDQTSWWPSGEAGR